MADEEKNESSQEIPNEGDTAVKGQPAKFSPIEETAQGEKKENLDLILDINVQLTVELGRTQMQIKDVIELSPGSVIELDKLAGEPVDILANDSLIAKGEVVVINENFGIRITEILGAATRIQKLGGAASKEETT